jgi:hypothetical protein
MLFDIDISPKWAPGSEDKPDQKLKDSGRNKSGRDFWWSINVPPVRVKHKRKHQRAKQQRADGSGRH